MLKIWGMEEESECILITKVVYHSLLLTIVVAFVLQLLYIFFLHVCRMAHQKEKRKQSKYTSVSLKLSNTERENEREKEKKK